MSYGQMVEDVKLSVNGKADVSFYGRGGGIVPTPTEILDQIRHAFGKAPGVSHYRRTQGTEVTR
jgi:2-oxoglutarate ferredoxin oxidoreductase subunit alpha